MSVEISMQSTIAKTSPSERLHGYGLKMEDTPMRRGNEIRAKKQYARELDVQQQVQKRNGSITNASGLSTGMKTGERNGQAAGKGLAAGKPSEIYIAVNETRKNQGSMNAHDILKTDPYLASAYDPYRGSTHHVFGQHALGKHVVASGKSKVPQQFTEQSPPEVVKPDPFERDLVKSDPFELDRSYSNPPQPEPVPPKPEPIPSIPADYLKQHEPAVAGSQIESEKFSKVKSEVSPSQTVKSKIEKAFSKPKHHNVCRADLHTAQKFAEMIRNRDYSSDGKAKTTGGDLGDRSTRCGGSLSGETDNLLWSGAKRLSHLTNAPTKKTYEKDSPLVPRTIDLSPASSKDFIVSLSPIVSGSESFHERTSRSNSVRSDDTKKTPRHEARGIVVASRYLAYRKNLPTKQVAKKTGKLPAPRLNPEKLGMNHRGEKWYPDRNWKSKVQKLDLRKDAVDLKKEGSLKLSLKLSPKERNERNVVKEPVNELKSGNTVVAKNEQSRQPKPASRESTERCSDGDMNTGLKTPSKTAGTPFRKEDTPSKKTATPAKKVNTPSCQLRRQYSVLMGLCSETTDESIRDLVFTPSPDLSSPDIPRATDIDRATDIPGATESFADMVQVQNKVHSERSVHENDNQDRDKHVITTGKKKVPITCCPPLRMVDLLSPDVDTKQTITENQVYNNTKDASFKENSCGTSTFENAEKRCFSENSISTTTAEGTLVQMPSDLGLGRQSFASTVLSRNSGVKNLLSQNSEGPTHYKIDSVVNEPEFFRISSGDSGKSPNYNGNSRNSSPSFDGGYSFPHGIHGDANQSLLIRSRTDEGHMREGGIHGGRMQEGNVPNVLVTDESTVSFDPKNALFDLYGDLEDKPPTPRTTALSDLEKRFSSDLLVLQKQIEKLQDSIHSLSLPSKNDVIGIPDGREKSVALLKPGLEAAASDKPASEKQEPKQLGVDQDQAVSKWDQLHPESAKTCLGSVSDVIDYTIKSTVGKGTRTSPLFVECQPGCQPAGFPWGVAAFPREVTGLSSQAGTTTTVVQRCGGVVESKTHSWSRFIISALVGITVFLFLLLISSFRIAQSIERGLIL